jgi:hypothetical protein
MQEEQVLVIHVATEKALVRAEREFARIGITLLSPQAHIFVDPSTRSLRKLAEVIRFHEWCADCDVTITDETGRSLVLSPNTADSLRAVASKSS